MLSRGTDGSAATARAGALSALVNEATSTIGRTAAIRRRGIIMR
jgi:hypothetical protein